MHFTRIKILFTAVFTLLSFTSIIAQEDLARGELPSRIGGNNCSATARGTASLQGSLNVQGVIPTGQKPPTFTVVLYASGIVIHRQRVKNGGAFNFFCIPTDSVSISTEVDGVEISSSPLGMVLPPPSSNRHDIYVNWSQAGQALQRKAEVISARNAYERSDETRKLFEKAMEELERKKTSNAEKLLRSLVEKDSKDFVAWSELGTIALSGEKFADAAASFESANKLDAAYMPALIGLGRSYIGMKEPAKAAELLAAAAEKQPDSADIHHYLGEAYLANKQGSLAIKHMNRAIEIAPAEKANLHLRMAALYHVAGAKHLAANEYKLLLEKYPSHPDKQKLERYIAENPPQN